MNVANAEVGLITNVICFYFILYDMNISSILSCIAHFVVAVIVPKLYHKYLNDALAKVSRKIYHILLLNHNLSLPLQFNYTK